MFKNQHRNAAPLTFFPTLAFNVLLSKLLNDSFFGGDGAMFKKLYGVAFLGTALAISQGALLAARPPAASSQERKEARELHPHIRTALRELREAKQELQTAAHDFGGHRKEALEAVDNAIKQLDIALQYDKK